ncbi:MAG: metal-sensitive transcriptional regulator [Ilumatobacteraceae bacterium]|nr:metal-sensitive transcriptional regulator [Ilumatobacteraceae bacterium]
MRGYTMNRDDYLLRLRRIEGQVRGLHRMIEADDYCIDVLTQLSSVTAALQSVAIGLVDEHLRHCVVQAAAQGDDEERDAKLTEAVQAISRLVRS